MIDLTGYRLTFGEEFNSRSISLTGSGTTWADTRSEWRVGAADIGFGRSSFVDASSGYDPFAVGGGVLTITAVPDRTASGVPGAWESGLLTTQGGFSQTYGYFEIRADFSNAPGAWNAFWLLPDQNIPDPNNRGQWQELDIVENYGVLEQAVYSHIHTTDLVPNDDWQQYLQVHSEMATPTGYHTYGMNWQADRISFYIDGVLIGSKATPSDMHGPMYLLLDLATQEPADGPGVPISSMIDYVRVYSADPNAVAVAHDTASSPDGYDPGLYGATAAGDTTPTPQPSGTTIGSGADKLVLKLSEDAYLGDAQFIVYVDGVQIGGTLTAHASHRTGQSELVTVLGDWGPGPHTVFVRMLNDRWDGTPDTDRNLYLEGATYNDVVVPAGTLGNLVGQSFQFVDSTTTNPPPTDPTPTDPTPTDPTPTDPTPTDPTPTDPTPPDPTPTEPNATTIGSGPDTLLLKMSEDAYLGDAQFNIYVDGVRIGGTLTSHASHKAGAYELFTVLGDWGVGEHTVFIHMINDRWDGTPDTDRNLYLEGVTYNGVVDAEGVLGNLVGQSFHFIDTAGTPTDPTPTDPTPTDPTPTDPTPTDPTPTDPSTTTIGSGTDSLVLRLSEDAYLGDAQFAVYVDGVQIGGTLTAHASHRAGEAELVTVLGNWSAGDHTVLIRMLNDRWDGTPDTDRNLYLENATYNGASVSGSSLGNLIGQSFHFIDI